MNLANGAPFSHLALYCSRECSSTPHTAAYGDLLPPYARIALVSVITGAEEHLKAKETAPRQAAVAQPN